MAFPMPKTHDEFETRPCCSGVNAWFSVWPHTPAVDPRDLLADAAVSTAACDIVTPTPSRHGVRG